MPEYKQVTLKDPKTGDYLVPRVYGTLGYQVVDGEITPPIDPQMNANTLEGHPASYFATADHTHTVDNITGILPVEKGGTGQSTLTPDITVQAARAIYAGTSDMTAGSSALTTGTIYLVYE